MLIRIEIDKKVLLEAELFVKPKICSKESVFRFFPFPIKENSNILKCKET